MVELHDISEGKVIVKPVISQLLQGQLPLRARHFEA
jgi:hypothetical protein